MNRNERLIFIAVIFFTAAIRIAFIEQKNLWFDEIYSWHITQGTVSQIVDDTSSDLHPPFYYFVLKLWNNVFGDSVFSMRMLSVLFSLASAIILFFLCLKITSNQNSIIILFLFAVSPLNLFYSQEARMASLNLFLNILSVYSVIRIIESSQNKNILKDKFSYLFIIFSIMACYTHYFSIPVFAANSLWLLISPRKNRKAFISVILFITIVIITYFPWIPILLSQASRGQQWRSGQNIYLVAKEILNYLRDSAMGLYYYNTPGWILRGITILLLLIIFVSGILSLKKYKSIQNNYKFILLVLFLTIFTAVAVAFRQRIEFFRYLSILVPYLLIFLIVPVSINTRRTLIFATVIFGLINIFGLYMYFKNDYKNNDYRKILTVMNNDIKQGEKIFAEPHYMGWIVDYYSTHGYNKVQKTENYGWGIYMMMDTIKSQHPLNFYLIIDYSSLDTAGYQGAINFLTNHYKLGYLKRFSIIPREVDLYRFEK